MLAGTLGSAKGDGHEAMPDCARNACPPHAVLQSAAAKRNRFNGRERIPGDSLANFEFNGLGGDVECVLKHAPFHFHGGVAVPHEVDGFVAAAQSRT